MDLSFPCPDAGECLVAGPTSMGVLGWAGLGPMGGAKGVGCNVN